ncbi:MAG: PEP-CTERM sorting domain-containing protein [Pirellulaceae bacterium]|nr:PEP-CTERM sorting domain-containing protein [Pirellulaceae bacterium]
MKAPNSIRPSFAASRRQVVAAILTATAAMFGLMPFHAARADLAPNLQLYSSMNNTTPYLHQAYWVDASGNGYDGRAYDVPAHDGGGNRSTAVDFTLAASRMTVQSGYDPLLDAGITDFSVSLWYYETMTVSSGAYLFTSGNNAGSGRGGFSLMSAAGVPQIRINDVGEVNDTRVTVNSDPINKVDISGEWRHLVAVFDRTGNVTGTANNVQIYVDNVMKNSAVLDDIVDGSTLESRPYNVLKALSGAENTVHGDQVNIGNQTSGTAANAFTGYMDDVAVYRGALSAADVATLYSASSLSAGTIATSGITPVMIHNFENNLGRSSETLGGVSDDYKANAATMKNFRQVTDATRGQVLEVNGLANVNEYVSYGDVLDPMDQSYTASVWFKIENTGNSQLLMSKGMNSSTGNAGWAVLFSTNDGLVVRANYDGTSDNRLGLSKALTAGDGQWHHLAVVFDQDAGLLKAYLDGAGSGDSGYENDWQLAYALESGNSFTQGTIFDTTQPLLLGHQGQTVTDGNAYPTVGRFDDFAVWTRALTPAEILGIYNGTLVYPIPTPPTGIPGDADGNGTVDDADAKRLATFWGATTKDSELTWWQMGDFNGDLKVDARDAAILAANWGYVSTPSESSATSAVPEPGSLIGLLTGIVALGLRRRRGSR